MGLLAVAVIILVLTGDNTRHSQQQKLDERVTLNKKDKLPYGTYVAYQYLPYLFPKALLSINKEPPGYWNNLSAADSQQVLIIMTAKFSAGEDEMKDLIDFVKNGNDIFICAIYISAAAERVMKCTSSSYDLNYIGIDQLDRPMEISLSEPPFSADEKYKYPGRTFNSYFTSLDTAATDVLGYDELFRPDFIHLRAGKGNIYVHLEPLAFSNYFLLHRNNISYYEKAFSLLPQESAKVVWDEYYLYKKDAAEDQQPQPGWITVLLRYPAFRAALLTAMLALVLYVLMEMRRKQRVIRMIRKPGNDSLDFVKTIGRLYYDQGDHRNLGRKMAAYFLEHVRNKYKLATHVLDEEFKTALHFKSGVDRVEIEQIVSYIKYVDRAVVVSSDQLMDFYKKLESFYKKA
jgi:hypothetical protein